MSTAPLLVIAAGGTGGHMFPAQALAEEMLTRGWRVKLTTDPRGARYAGGFPAEVRRVVLRSATFSRGGVLAKVLVPMQIALGCLRGLIDAVVDRPACVVGFGGYPAIPSMTASWVLRIPRVIHEQNGVLGRVNEVFARRVNAVACGTWPTELPGGVAGHNIGNPVRQGIAEVAGAKYHPPGEGPLEVLVFGGSQGASIMARVPDALAKVEPEMRSRLVVAQQARDADADAVRAAYKDLGIPADIRPFFEDMPARLSRAQLVICRSGASSVADIAAVGRPAIFVPLAMAKRDEQSANAAGLVEAGAAVLIREDELTPDALAGHIAEILGAPGHAAQMAAAAAAQGKPRAVLGLAALVEELSGSKQ